MEFFKETDKFSFGFSSGKIVGTGAAKPAYKDILIDADTIVSELNGRYRGLGCISGNNSSRLLLDYKALHPEIYHEILRLLFEKGYGAELSHLKLEFGADINSSSGTEPSTMRYEDEIPDVTRGAGFILAADALKINPDLNIDLLRWGEPGWVKNAFKVSIDEGYKARYKWYVDTIDEAYSRLGIKFTHISPDANETECPDLDWLIYFSEHLKAEKNKGYDYSKIKIVASDEVGSRTIAGFMLINDRLREAIDVIGLHYTTYGDENTEHLYNEYGKEIWYSEGIAPSNIPELSVKKDLSGITGRNSAVDTANRIINGWKHGKMTMYEFQPAVAAYYDGSCYYPKHLIRANEPWNGQYEIGSGFYMAMHFTRFIGDDWYPVESACYGDGTENHYIENTTSNYLTLMPKDRSDFTMIFTNDRGISRNYRIRLDNCNFTGRTINIIETSSPELFETVDNGWFRFTGSEVLEDDTFTITVKPNSIMTVTTKNADFVSGTFENISPAKKRLTLPYSDDFSYSEYDEDFLKNRGYAPLFTTDQGGAFEVVSADGENYLEQKITKDIIPENWRFRGTPNPITCLGDDSWSNYLAQVNIKLCGDSEDNYAGIGVRYNSAVACEVTSNCGFAVKVYYSGKWELLFMDKTVQQGTAEKFSPDDEHTISAAAIGNVYIAYLDGKMLGSYNEVGAMQANGRVSLLSGYFRNQFSDLEVKPVESMSNYVTAADALSPYIDYFGNHVLNAMDSYKYSNRTNAVLSEGTGFAICYCGCGFALCGTVKSAVLKIELDGKVIADNFRVGDTEYRQCFYRFDSCRQGVHLIKVTVTEGEIIFNSLLAFANTDEYCFFKKPALITEKQDNKKTAALGIAGLAAAGAVTALIFGIKKKRKK